MHFICGYQVISFFFFFSIILICFLIEKNEFTRAPKIYITCLSWLPVYGSVTIGGTIREEILKKSKNKQTSKQKPVL